MESAIMIYGVKRFKYFNIIKALPRLMRNQQQNQKRCSSNTHVRKSLGHYAVYNYLYKGVQKVCYVTCKTHLC